MINYIKLGPLNLIPKELHAEDVSNDLNKVHILAFPIND